MDTNIIVNTARLALQMCAERPRRDLEVVAADAARIVVLANIFRMSPRQRSEFSALLNRYGATVVPLPGAACALRFSGHGYRSATRCDALQIA